jgi:hypothetical protein
MNKRLCNTIGTYDSVNSGINKSRTYQKPTESLPQLQLILFYRPQTRLHTFSILLKGSFVIRQHTLDIQQRGNLRIFSIK